jgi:hypothetical protein
MEKILPNRRQVVQDIETAFSVNTKRLKTVFRIYNGVIHIATDGWTDRRGNKFIGLTAHYTPVTDAKVRPRSLLIDFIP